MCGIFGWIKPTANTETDLDLVDIFKEGLIHTQERGEDATGFYTPGTGIVKDVIDAEEFVTTEVPDSIANERFIIGHCRMASSKYDNDNITNPNNAQPFESENWILIHNGTINTPKLKNYSYTSDVDSEVIISYAEKTSIKNAFASIDGSATVVLYNKKDRKIYFWTNGERPITIALYKGIIFFASTKKILRKALRFDHTLGIFPEASFATIYENEPLVYDLKKNRFTRQAIIEKKVAKKITTTYSSNSLSNSKFRSYEQITPTSVTKNIPRGCGSACPPSNQKVIGYCPGNKNPKVVRISNNGDKSSYTIGAKMSGENIPIDFLADHLESFEVGVKFVPGYGYLGIIRFNNKEVFRSGSFKPEAQQTFDHAVNFLEEKYRDIMDEHNIA